MADSPIDQIKEDVYNYVKERIEKNPSAYKAHTTFARDEVYVVWFCFILGGWKGLVSTSLPDGMYYEVTYNTNKRETYLDAYKKLDNVVLSDSEGSY